MADDHPRPDPLALIPANRAILDALRDQAEPGVNWSVGGYELHTHPDLGERMSLAARGLQRIRELVLYGCPVTVTGASVAFVFALGTGFLAFRLSPADIPLAVQMGGKPVRELAREGLASPSQDPFQDPFHDPFQRLEPEWIWLDPWNADVPMRQWIGDLSYFAERAHDYALTLE